MLKKISVRTLRKYKENHERFSMLTAYDYSTAQVLDKAEIDGILVGDSLAMVVLGHENTYNITIDEMLIVARGAKRAMVVTDMPFMSYTIDIPSALTNIGNMIKLGSRAVKLEGCNDHIISLVKRCTETGIPVLGHLGFTPQLMNTLGGHKIQGKTSDKIEAILESAKKLEEAGCFGIVLELMPAESAKYITENLKIPTIGIGAGVNCSGQVVVIDDILGKFTDFTPKFIKKYTNLHDEIMNGVINYKKEVKDKIFPSEKESFELNQEEKEKLIK